jgi:hypothetical protein
MLPPVLPSPDEPVHVILKKFVNVVSVPPPPEILNPVFVPLCKNKASSADAVATTIAPSANAAAKATPNNLKLRIPSTPFIRDYE